MRSQNLLLVACIAMVWSAAAAAQGTPQGGAQTARGGQNQSAAASSSKATVAAMYSREPGSASKAVERCSPGPASEPTAAATCSADAQASAFQV